MKKQRNRNHWILPYAYAGRRSEVHIWLIDNEKDHFFGKYHVVCGAASEIVATLEEATQKAMWFTHGGALSKTLIKN